MHSNPFWIMEYLLPPDSNSTALHHSSCRSRWNWCDAYSSFTGRILLRGQEPPLQDACAAGLAASDSRNPSIAVSIVRPITRQLSRNVSISQISSVDSRDQHAHDAVVAEAVLHAHRIHAAAGPGDKFLDLLLGVAAGGHVVLVRFLRELGDAGNRVRRRSRSPLPDPVTGRNLRASLTFCASSVRSLLLVVHAACVRDLPPKVLAVQRNGQLAERREHSSARGREPQITFTSGISLSGLSSRSTGLSSKKAIESVPRFSSAAISRRFCALSCQLIRNAAKCSGRSSMPGWFCRAAMASSRLFLLQTARRMPRW